MSKKNNNSKLLFFIFFICLTIASLNILGLKNKTISKKSSLNSIDKILSKELSDEISTLLTKKDSNNLYTLYKNSNNHYGLASFKRNNVLYNRYEFNKHLLNDNNKKFNSLVVNDDSSSKVVFFADFSRTTASSIKLSFNDISEEISINKKEPIIKIIDFPVNNSKNLTIEIFDEFKNEISNAL